MAYLSLFTLGVSRYAAADLDGAISRFSDALSQLVDRTSVLDQSLAYLYRGSVYSPFAQSIPHFLNFKLPVE